MVKRHKISKVINYSFLDHFFWSLLSHIPLGQLAVTSSTTDAHTPWIKAPTSWSAIWWRTAFHLYRELGISNIYNGYRHIIKYLNEPPLPLFHFSCFLTLSHYEASHSRPVERMHLPDHHTRKACSSSGWEEESSCNHTRKASSSSGWEHASSCQPLQEGMLTVRSRGCIVRLRMHLPVPHQEGILNQVY